MSYSTIQLIDLLQRTVGDLSTEKQQVNASAWASLMQHYHDVDESSFIMDFGRIMPPKEALKHLAGLGIVFGEPEHGQWHLHPVDMLPVLRDRHEKLFARLTQEQPFDKVEDKLFALAEKTIPLMGIDQLTPDGMHAIGYWIQQDYFAPVINFTYDDDDIHGKVKQERPGLFYRERQAKSLPRSLLSIDQSVEDHIRLFATDMEDLNGLDINVNNVSLTVSEADEVVRERAQHVEIRPFFGLEKGSEFQRLGTHSLYSCADEKEEAEESERDGRPLKGKRADYRAFPDEAWGAGSMLHRFAYGKKINSQDILPRKKKMKTKAVKTVPVPVDASYEERMRYDSAVGTVQMTSHILGNKDGVNVDSNTALTLMVVYQEEVLAVPRIKQVDFIHSYLLSAYADKDDRDAFEEEHLQPCADEEDDICDSAWDDDDEEDDE